MYSDRYEIGDEMIWLISAWEGVGMWSNHVYAIFLFLC